MQKYHSYESWLKTNGYKTWSICLSYTRQIEKDLGGIDLEKNTFPGYLENSCLNLILSIVYCERRIR